MLTTTATATEPNEPLVLRCKFSGLQIPVVSVFCCCISSKQNKQPVEWHHKLTRLEAVLGIGGAGEGRCVLGGGGKEGICVSTFVVIVALTNAAVGPCTTSSWTWDIELVSKYPPATRLPGNPRYMALITIFIIRLLITKGMPGRLFYVLFARGSLTFVKKICWL